MEVVRLGRSYGDFEQRLGDLSSEVFYVEFMFFKNVFICLVMGLNVMIIDRFWNGLFCVMFIGDIVVYGLFNCKINKSK